jgi:uncharacterized membrane protein (UPF0127 family)
VIVRNITRGKLLGERISDSATFLSRLLGLIGRPGLSPGEGIWIRPCRSIHSFGMRFEFDALFLDGEGKVVGCCPRFRRNRVSPWFREASGVLELPPGTIERSRTEAGDEIAFER